jgi:hypothetical protein
LFFLATPLGTADASYEMQKREDGSARPALGAATLAVGLLLVLAGLFAASAQARWIDLSFGLALMAFGSWFWAKKRESESVTV